MIGSTVPRSRFATGVDVPKRSAAVSAASRPSSIHCILATDRFPSYSPEAAAPMIRLATFLFLTAIFLPTLAMAEPFSGRLVDLTHSFGADTIFWPTEEGFVLE